jgi:hypothetical protein
MCEDEAMIFSALTLLVLVQSGPVQAPNAVYRSETAAVAFAVEEVCLPSVTRSVPVRQLYTPGLFMRGRSNASRSHVQSFVWIEDRNQACTVVASRGGAAALRAQVAEVLARRATRTTVLSDSGPGSRDANGDFRQESWCMRIDGQPVFLVMSSSEAANRNRLMASFGLDRGGHCPS